LFHVGGDCSDAVDAAVSADIGPEAAGLARALGERQLHMLTRLAEIGLEIAAAVERRATAEASTPGDAASGCDWGLVYARIARAVHLTIALQSKLLKDVIALDEGRVPTVDAEAEARRARTDARIDRIGRIAHRVLEAECDDEDAVERLSSTLWERLEDEDICGDLSDRPIGEIVALICKDLGLDPDWRLWAHEAWAVEEAEAGAPGSPFVDRAAPDAGPPMAFPPHAASP